MPRIPVQLVCVAARPEAVGRDQPQAVLALAVLADGRIASGSGDGTVRLWDPHCKKANRALTTLVPPQGLKPRSRAAARC